MSQHQQRPSMRLAALAVSAMILATSGTGAARELLSAEGVATIGTVDPSYVDHRGQGGPPDESDGHPSGSSHQETCLINVFSTCLFTLVEDSSYEQNNSEHHKYWYYDVSDDNATGYYVDLLGGMFYSKVSSGETRHESGSGQEDQVTHYDEEDYQTNLLYSTHRLDDQEYVQNNTYQHADGVSNTQAESGVRAPVGGTNVTFGRQQNGTSSTHNQEYSAGSNATERGFFGIPFFASGDSQSHDLDDAQQAAWNRTLLAGNVFLVNPVDSSHLEIVALSLDKGAASGSGSHSQNDSADSYTKIFGFEVFGRNDTSHSASAYTFASEWMHLMVDAANGTATGRIAYDHGHNESSQSQGSSQETDLFTVPLYGESHEANEQAAREWRDVSFGLDAMDGFTSLSLGSWDDSSASEKTFQNTFGVVGITVGDEGQEVAQTHSDGVGFRFQIAPQAGGGILDVYASYENRSSSKSSQTDYTLGGSPLFGSSSSSSETSRAVNAGVQSGSLGTGASAYDENVSTSRSDNVRLAGSDLAGTSSQDQHRAYGADAHALSGVFVFHVLYTQGNSNNAVNVAGFPLGVRDQYKEFDVSTGGAMPNLLAGNGLPATPATDSGNIYVYNFEHSETANNNTVYAGDSDIGRFERNVSKTSVNVIVLDGVAHADASRDFTDNHIFAGQETEIVDAGSQTAKGGAGTDGFSAGPANVERSGVTASLFFGYLEFADAIALALLFATYCVNPGQSNENTVRDAAIDAVQLLGGTVSSSGTPVAFAGGPATIVGEVAIFLALLALCGLPVIAPIPLFLLSPCILVPLAVGIVFLVVGIVTLIVPDSVDGPVQNQVPTVHNAYDTVYDNYVKCIWLTLPTVVRNPQPVLAVMDPASTAADGPASSLFPSYDAARLTVWSLVDSLANADQVVPNPAGIPQPPATPPLPAAAPPPLPAIPAGPNVNLAPPLAWPMARDVLDAAGHRLPVLPRVVGARVADPTTLGGAAAAENPASSVPRVAAASPGPLAPPVRTPDGGVAPDFALPTAPAASPLPLNAATPSVAVVLPSRIATIPPAGNGVFLERVDAAERALDAHRGVPDEVHRETPSPAAPARPDLGLDLGTTLPPGDVPAAASPLAMFGVATTATSADLIAAASATALGFLGLLGAAVIVGGAAAIGSRPLERRR